MESAASHSRNGEIDSGIGPPFHGGHLCPAPGEALGGGLSGVIGRMAVACGTHLDRFRPMAFQAFRPQAHGSLLRVVAGAIA